MRYLLDSNIIIDFGRNYQPTIEFLKRTLKDSDEVFISVVTEAEMFAGESFRQLDEFLNHSFPAVALDVNSDIARKAGLLKRSNPPLDLVDALIAATAILNDLVLITRNRKHFEGVLEGVKELKLAEGI